MLKRVNLLLLIIFSIISISCVGEKNIKKDKNGEKEVKIPLKGVFHKVKKGETLWRISYTYKIPINDILEINDINKDDPLYIGDEIFIPNVTKILKIDLKKGDKKVDKKNIAIKKGKKGRSKPLLNSKYLNSFIWPVDGVVVLKYGKYGGIKNDGLDIAAPKNTPIKSIMSGKVLFSGSQPGYGNIIIIKHKDNIITIYAHNDKNSVSEGVEVKKGDKIGTVGRSGNSKRYKLHFEIRKGVKPIDPYPYLIKDIN